MLKGILISATLFCVSPFLLMGCADQSKYYDAVKAQNTTIQSLRTQAMQEKRDADIRHEERMTQLIKDAMTAAASTEDKTDDVLVPMLIMNMEDKRIMAEALTAGKNNMPSLQPIKAPETAGEFIRNSTGALLGVGAIVTGIIQSNNMKDIAVAGMNAAGTRIDVSGDGNAITNDSYKTGSQNSINGDSNYLYGDKIGFGLDNPEDPVSSDGNYLGIPGCSSFESYNTCKCSVKPSHCE